ncbi:hypothetical protein RJT34_20217 [Clitoria ternatea]|uniref:IMS import disulfide relay-system CHCH-CHCH-like Cx9C domain-containing protein n=1 Tax=Clitoria ternatea TaxID=43366 RepID=A0AAN9IT21_CLITE
MRLNAYGRFVTVNKTSSLSLSFTFLLLSLRSLREYTLCVFSIFSNCVVDMKENKNSTSILKRILVNCASQATAYGSCVAAKVPDIERDVCVKEFLALKSCMQNMLKN